MSASINSVLTLALALVPYKIQGSQENCVVFVRFLNFVARYHLSYGTKLLRSNRNHTCTKKKTVSPVVNSSACMLKVLVPFRFRPKNLPISFKELIYLMLADPSKNSKKEMIHNIEQNAIIWEKIFCAL